MKNLSSFLTCVCITLFSLNTVAQEHRSPLNDPDHNKPLLFASLPDRIPVSIEYLNSLFGSAKGQGVIIAASDAANGARIEGEVVSTGSEYNNRLQSMIIRTTNFNGARFTVSRYTDEQGVVSYSGRILSFQHGDAYELKNDAGSLVLIKRKFYSLVNE